MKVLLLSISPNQSGNRQRTDYLADALRLAGHEPYIVRWKSWRQFGAHNEEITNQLSIQLLPTAAKWLPNNKIPIWNQTLAWMKIKGIVRKLKIDAVICPNNWYVIGYPPHKFEVPIIIDYFDLLSDEMEQQFLVKDRTALCTSIELQIRASRWTKNAHWIPTPIDTSKFCIPKIEAKKLIGISPDTLLISLIGLTASRKLYFMDAIDQLDIPNVKCLLIGDGELADPIRQKIMESRHPDRFEMLGKVPYSEVPKYFCASDIGLYPGDEDDYYQCACPIKVLEYTAAGAEVVSNELRELKHWGFPNVRLVSPSSEGFQEAIRKAVTSQGNKGELEQFTLSTVSKNINCVLHSVLFNDAACRGAII
ncbi:hypothetical protein PAESOLCIP111_01568 [Paenibacillus solanacearum]|uniref:Glycosyltransferase n=1 Tax=Paenibacillus solanacearum TaxID=2048548 RepID=A0A916NW09_9BACL|nr:glycosyltransferase [Paenibacillus solanacearum]CAG7613160.1 hypothetical protein PAESOLCIP111_01568 [Paenibacillus solanacearum]